MVSLNELHYHQNPFKLIKKFFLKKTQTTSTERETALEVTVI